MKIQHPLLVRAVGITGAWAVRRLVGTCRFHFRYADPMVNPEVARRLGLEPDSPELGIAERYLVREDYIRPSSARPVPSPRRPPGSGTVSPSSCRPTLPVRCARLGGEARFARPKRRQSCVPRYSCMRVFSRRRGRA
jgi:hypothetical protein